MTSATDAVTNSAVQIRMLVIFTTSILFCVCIYSCTSATSWFRIVSFAPSFNI